MIGKSTFYVATHGMKSVKKIGTTNRVVTGTTIQRIGAPGESPGKVAMFKAWNKALDESEIETVFKNTAVLLPASQVEAKVYRQGAECFQEGLNLGDIKSPQECAARVLQRREHCSAQFS